MTTTQQDFLRCLRSALFTGESYTLSEDVIAEARQQTVYSLIVSGVDAYQHIAQNVQLAYAQKELDQVLAPIPYVVLKGQAAAVYYPQPLKRTLGDIDIIVRPEDLSLAYDTLKNNGYDTSEPLDEGYEIEKHFYRDGALVELHKSYAKLNTQDQEKLLDQWIYDGILSPVMGTYNNQPFPMLAEPLNGLVLLAHISKHLEAGLGFRQIIDWVMYVDKELHDAAWPAFRKKAEQLGLTKLAKVSARVGQLYLGLPEENITWCRNVDDQLCAEFLDYVFACGNFGRKTGANNIVTAVFSQGKTIKSFFIGLQQSGEGTWKAYKKCHWLKPFAWIYQSFRLAKRGLSSVTPSEIIVDYKASKQRNQLMEKLEATQSAARNARK